MPARLIKDNEYVELRSVWQEVFGDDPLYVDELYYQTKAKGYTFEDNGLLQSFLTVLDVGSYLGKPVKMIYAVCTRPEARGRGYASHLVKFAADEAVNSGAISLICPSEQGLVEFYSRIGFKPEFYAGRACADAEDLGIKVSILDADSYMRCREDFLSEVPHIELNSRFSSFIHSDRYNAQGFLLFAGGDAICTISYGSDDEMGVSEIIVNPALSGRSSEIVEQLAGGLAALFEVEKCYYRTIGSMIYDDESGSRLADGTYIQGMIYGADSHDGSMSETPYFGYPLD